MAAPVRILCYKFPFRKLEKNIDAFLFLYIYLHRTFKMYIIFELRIKCFVLFFHLTIFHHYAFHRWSKQRNDFHGWAILHNNGRRCHRNWIWIDMRKTMFFTELMRRIYRTSQGHGVLRVMKCVSTHRNDYLHGRAQRAKERFPSHNCSAARALVSEVFS